MFEPSFGQINATANRQHLKTKLFRIVIIMCSVRVNISTDLLSVSYHSCLVTMCPLELTYLLSVSYLSCLVTICPLELTYLPSVSYLLCLVTMCPLELTYLRVLLFVSSNNVSSWVDISTKCITFCV